MLSVIYRVAVILFSGCEPIFPGVYSSLYCVDLLYSILDDFSRRVVELTGMFKLPLIIIFCYPLESHSLLSLACDNHVSALFCYLCYCTATKDLLSLLFKYSLYVNHLYLVLARGNN